MNQEVEKRRYEILNTSIWKLLFVVALPVVLNQLIVAFFALFDTYFASLIGTSELGAVTFVAPINTTVNAVALGIGIAGTALASKFIGLNEYHKAKKTIGNMITVVIIVVLVIVTSAFIYSHEILYSASLRGEQLEIADQYFKIVLIATPFIFLNNIHMSLFRAQGNTYRILKIHGLSVVVKFGITYLLVVHTGAGVLGIAYSTIISGMFVSVFAIYDLFIKKTSLKIEAKDLAFDKQIVFPLLILALPIVTERSVQSFGHVLVNAYANSFGEAVLSGYGITNRLNSVAFSSVSGIGVAVVSLISQNLALGHVKRIKEIINKAMISGFIVAIVLISVVFLVSKDYAAFLSGDDQDVYRHTLNAISVYSISVIPFGIIQIINGVYQGYKKTHYTMVVALSRLWVFRVFLIYLLVNYTELAEYSIWYGMLISNILSAILSVIIFFLDKDLRSIYKKKKEIVISNI